jgi:hypothetical protein
MYRLFNIHRSKMKTRRKYFIAHHLLECKEEGNM